MIKKADILLCIAIIILGLLAAFLPLALSQSGSSVRVTADGQVYGIYALNEDQTILLEKDGHKNVIVIKDGAVYMESSTCKNQICVEHGPIKTANDCIVCLPNKVVVEIVDSEGGEVDVISG